MRNQLAGVWFTFLVIVTIKLTGSHLRKTGIVLAYHWGRLDGRSSLPAVAVRVRGCMLKSGWTRRQSAGDIVSQLASFLFKSFIYSGPPAYGMLLPTFQSGSLLLTNFSGNILTAVPKGVFPR